ncbi:hypothetical protein [Asticcacaulis benevestitus]|nr:hypothetical protein [Asticcacaulis benevestitus]
MKNAMCQLSAGLFADVANNWLILVVEADPRNAGVFYLGAYPYAQDGTPLHPDAPAVLTVWDRSAPGARQISERQKRFAHYTTTTLFEPVYELRHA